MSRKNDILTNLREYSSDQIAEAINDGVVTISSIPTKSKAETSPANNSKNNPRRYRIQNHILKSQ